MKTGKTHLYHPGVMAALCAALLFGCGTPLAKWLLDAINPWMLAGLLYLGSGIGLTVYRLVSRKPLIEKLSLSEWGWLGSAVVFGGIAGPLLLLWGLMNMPASAASLLLNVEGVFTALLAWFVFHENVNRRIALGMILIVIGSVFLSGGAGGMSLTLLWPSLAIVAACLAWAIDNNLTRKISLSDASWIAAVKGWVAGSVNAGAALALGSPLPDWPEALAAMSVGCVAYGISLSLFVVALRHIGTARTGAYFSIAPFFGAALSIAVLGEPLTTQLTIAGVLMAIGVWLHLTEQHHHRHHHGVLEHEHMHTHDEHHQHSHDPPVPPGTRHRHKHRHMPLTHAHAHFPDAHHDHKH